jgi:phosphatidylglycerophosphate synthase
MVDVGDDAEVPHSVLRGGHGAMLESAKIADVSLVLAIGVMLVVAGLVLLLNLFGAAELVIRRVTSRSLGELAPGFAASRRGFRTYASLILAIGILCVGLAMTARFLPLGAALLVLGAMIFGIASVIAIVGEVETYRALKR